ncbi:MAG: DUF748 domain-containing protein, partial [bacterium]
MEVATWRTRLYRWRRWLIALAVVLLVRAALPEVLRRVIVSQASQALHAQVDIGDVDLNFWRGGVGLEDVAVRALNPAGADAPPAPTVAANAAAADAPPPAGGTPASPPPAFGVNPALIAFKRFAVELHYLPLFRKTIQLRDIELVSPRIALDRLADGEINLMALVPKQEVAVAAGGTPAALGTPAADATPFAEATPAAAGAGWKVGLDRFVLRDGRLRFRDMMLAGSEPVEVGIDQISVEEIALTPEVYGEPARIHLKLGLDEGVVDVNARLKLVDGQPVVTTEITANRLPLRRARLYVPKVGWSDLHGELDLALTYELEPQVKNQLSGTAALRDVAVSVPTLEDVAVGWKSLSVSLDTIDLLAQHAAVKEVALDGATLQVRAGSRDTLPAFDPGGGAAPVPPSPSPSGSGVGVPPAPTPGEAGVTPAQTAGAGETST